MSIQSMRAYFAIAERVKKGSSDIHTKIGAIIVDSKGEVLVEASNAIPKGLSVSAERLERPVKYQYIEHAERNACYHAAKKGIQLEDTIMIMSCNPVPCTECARALIQSGVKMIVGRDTENIASSKWDDSCILALEMLIEANVAVVFVAEDESFRIASNTPNLDVEFLGKTLNKKL